MGNPKRSRWVRRERAGWVPGWILGCLLGCLPAADADLEVQGVPVELTLRASGERAVRVTLQPIDHSGGPPPNPALVAREAADPVLRLRQLDGTHQVEVGGLRVKVGGDPLRVSVTRADGSSVQQVSFDATGTIGFPLDEQPVLGLGEGGPRPAEGENWRQAPVEFDRRGRLHRMDPRWQGEAYGSRNPVPLLIGTQGWGLFFASPWGRIDLSEAERGRFLPIEKKDPRRMRQDHGNQREQLGKGIPPMEHYLAGFRDLFIFDASDPAAFMKDLSTLSGAAALPPKWALGYMQSHRTLEDDRQLVEVADTFREKRIPIDAVIYLGTGFTPRGWNRPQPSFDFNPEVFRREPREVIDELHERNVKVVLHMVPWDRDRIALLDEETGRSYWQEHEELVRAGVDGWWPDEGDWFDLFERMERHRMYYEGPISTRPDRRPWSLHRNGYLGIARWGGWVWSGDTHSSWKTLETQVAVGINHSLSLSPYWGSDIGGFFPTPELSGELYARWFQFGAFCPSFRAHGRTWWTRLPWGWGLDTLGPVEFSSSPDPSSLNDPRIEQVCRKYAELRYRLLSYNYQLAWQARESGMPMMRAMWLHHPEDPQARGRGDQFLWGRDLLIAPVVEKGATTREVYLPEGAWYDFWSGELRQGGATISCPVDLETMPIHVRAGALLPFDPLRQFTGETVDDPLTIRIYRGADGRLALYQDDGISLDYLEGAAAVTDFRWDDDRQRLHISARRSESLREVKPASFRIELVPGGESQQVEWSGEDLEVGF